MSAYYNENDPEAAHVLRALVREGVIAPGDVDNRSIEEVMPDDIRGYKQVHLFAGGGFWSVAARMAGWPDDRELWTGSAPCQPFSIAGLGRGANDKRHLWPDFFRLIRSKNPTVIMGEQISGKAGFTWFDGVAADLEGIGYSCGAVDIPACAVNAPHIRQRLYWIASRVLADAKSVGRGPSPVRDEHKRTQAGLGPEQKSSDGFHRLSGEDHFGSTCEWQEGMDGRQRRIKPGVPVLVNGSPEVMALRRIAGNAIVSTLAAQVIASYMESNESA